MSACVYGEGRMRRTGGGLAERELCNLDQMHTVARRLQAQQYSLSSLYAPLGGSKGLRETGQIAYMFRCRERETCRTI